MTAIAADLATAPAADALRAAVAPMDRIGLDEVLQRAALQTRTDRKYFLPAAAVPQLFATIGSDFAVLAIDGRTAAAYDSVYFDTPRLDLFRAHRQRRRRRYKIRTAAISRPTTACSRSSATAAAARPSNAASLTS